MQLFLEVDNTINAWNSNPQRTSEMGHNFMSDWTTEEKKKLNGLTFPEPFDSTNEILSEPTIL